ncbi:MAG TPA: ABC transporter substrate-binding protein [Streptosporangiaceae bacterium]
MQVRSRLLAAVAAAAALTLAAGCGSQPGSSPAAAPGASPSSFPVTVQAANGGVHLTARPDSIVSLSPSATEMLYAIGAGSQVKAVDSDSDYPSQAPMTKLSGFQPNVEAIANYKPDLVVISNNIDGLEKHLAALSIPVLDLPAPGGLNGAYAEFDQLGQATGHLAAAQHKVASLRSQVAKIVASVPRKSPAPTYYYELDQTYFTATSSTFIGKVLAMLGLVNIADKVKGAAAAGGYPQLSSEYIVKADPDYVILADTICCHQSTATVARRPGWAGLTSVKDGHVIALNDDIASRWGPRIVDLMRTVAARLSGGSQ